MDRWRMTQNAKDKQGNEKPFCEERWRLSQAFADASRQLMEIQNEQMQAAIDGDSDFSRFDDLLHMAREAKDQAKYELIDHTEEHHC
jgi:hypothetical protein